MTIDGPAAVRRLYDEVFNAGNLAVADELASPAFVSHGGPGAGLTGPASLARAATVLRGAFDDLDFEVQDVFASGDRVAVRWQMTGTHTGDGLGAPPTGEAKRQEGIVIYRLDERGLAEQWSRIGPA